MISLVSAPSSLGLKPLYKGRAPGAAKAPGALRAAGLFERFAEIGAVDDGAVLPGRYRDDADPARHRVRNQAKIIDHSRRLAAQLDSLLDRGSTPLVIGGDCSILIGSALALNRRGRYGLVHLDGHTDFRHPGNSERCASLAGEDLAAAVGLHWPGISNLDGRAPYFAPQDVVHVGYRDDDEHQDEARQLLGAAVSARKLKRDLQSALGLIREIVTSVELDGYWVHVDVDILDPSFMPAVDSPDPGGIDPEQFIELLASLAPRASGAQVTVFDPDLDPDGRYATLLADLLFKGLRDLGVKSNRGH
jgi:arginase